MDLKSRVGGFGDSVVEELGRISGEPDAKSVDSFEGRFTGQVNSISRRDDSDKHFPDEQKLDRYWQIYKEVPLVRYPIRSFASEVIGPGYYVDADNQEVKEELESWLSQCSIVDGEVDKDFSILLKKIEIHREVKGTGLVEKVSNEEGGLYGFKLMRPSTVRAFTKPGQNVLLPPDYDFQEHSDNSDDFIQDDIKDRDFFTTRDGDVAAYVQIDDAVFGQEDGYYIAFSRDDIIKLTRDSDIGEVFGTSRLEAVEDRLNSLLMKLEDNDRAIELMAWPILVGSFGSEDDPWPQQKIDDIASEHQPGDFEPGMKHFFQGDVDWEMLSGEVAEIQEALQFDLNYILSEMPMPKYSMPWTSDVNQFTSRSKSARLERQLEEARKEIEMEWTPVLKEKAQEMNYDPDDVNALRIGEDPQDIGVSDIVDDDGVPEDSDSLPENSAGEANNPDGNNSNEDNVGPAGENNTRPPASTEDRDGGADIR